MRFHLKIPSLQRPTPNAQRVSGARTLGGSTLNVECSLLGGGSRRSQRGVALIITVIMLSVITFLAVAFLALSGREKGAVKTATDQTTAREAANTAMVRAQGELLAGILASGNLANYDLLVSTNYINDLGYQTSGVGDQLTNVNYRYPNGNLVTGNDALQNVANLFYDPSAPVFITNRLAANSVEFRHYLDLNRNGRPELSGYRRVTNNLNQPLLDASNQFVTNYVIGDPQWIGGLERIELPHSATNKFAYRYAYAAVPVGKTLDVNYIHNQTLSGSTMAAAGRNFFRNQGVGSWEINLAAMLYDLNTNSTYGWGLGNIGYYYNPLIGAPIQGNAFVDAAAIYSYRLNGRPNLYWYAPTTPAFPTNGLASVTALYGANPFTTDFVDGYSDGFLVSTNGVGMPSPGLISDTDNPDRPWAGANPSYHLFTTQDLLDPNKVNRPGGGYKFTDRLYMAGTNASTYDQYTYYRLLSQLGTDSAPDDSDRLNLNYANVPPFSATNFIRWNDSRVTTAFVLPQDQANLVFFTNAAERLLGKYTQDWLSSDANYYTNFFGTNQAFGITRIPVLTTNGFVYTPSVHRLLQIAANLTDTKTETRWPSVFRPIFDRDPTGLYISGYEQVPTNNLSAYLVQKPVLATNVLSGNNQHISVYGVPWVVGAKKGLPNFNELSMHSLFQVTRKLQITRASTNAPRSTWQTNMMYTVGVSNAIAVEAWNSYRNDFTNPVLIQVFGDVAMALTNEFGIPLSSNGPLTNDFLLSATTITNLWRGYGAAASPDSRSFVIPLRTNIAFLPESVYRSGPNTFTTNLNISFETGLTSYAMPQWGLKISGRLRFIMQLNDANGPIIDYVQLDNLDSVRNISEEIRDPDLATGFNGLWSTNLLRNSNLPQGIFDQLDVSLGNHGTDTTQWKDYDRRSNPNVEFEVDYFRALYRLQPLKYGGLVNTSLVQQVPFTPTRRVLQQFSWQANDPLVHYLAGDLLDLARTNNVERPLLSQPLQLLKNIGVINDRYSPWGGNPVNQSDDDVNRYNVAVKDPAMTSSDGWQFPTNAFASLGWLGRVHRGTPWQTVYMKASDLNISQFTAPLTNISVWVNSYPDPASRWGRWSGNPNFLDAFYTRPVTDRLLFDLFTTALNDNASRGQLSVNQTNLASWSALFGGVVVLTNSTSTNLLGQNIQPTFTPMVVEPAGLYDSLNPSTWPPMVRLVAGINAERSRTFTNGTAIYAVHPGGWFQSAGDLLSVPELTDASPFLGLKTNSLSFQRGINDAAYEWLPQQVMSLVRLGEARFVIYAYGQALRPAENSIITSGGAFFGLCTNYQIMAEVAARAVVRVEGSANPADINNANPKRRYPPHLVIENYNFLPPE